MQIKQLSLVFINACLCQTSQQIECSRRRRAAARPEQQLPGQATSCALPPRKLVQLAGWLALSWLSQ